MRTGFGQRIGGVLLGAAFLIGSPEPALAWGALTQAAAADRTFAILVARAPWLAPHREAFLWGALAADMQDAPGAVHLSAARTHAPETVAALWREAKRTGASSRAFVLGWAANVAAQDERLGWARDEGHAEAVRAAIAAFPGLKDSPPPADDPAFQPLLDLAVDAAVAPRTANLMRDLATAAWHHTGSPAGAPLMGIVARVLGVDEPTYLAMGGLTAAMGARGLDRYLMERARFGRVERWLEPARAAETRTAVGDLNPLLTRAAERAVARLDAMLKEKP